MLLLVKCEKISKVYRTLSKCTPTYPYVYYGKFKIGYGKLYRFRDLGGLDEISVAINSRPLFLLNSF